MAACQLGDTIVIKPSTYAAQSVSATKTAPGCTVIGEPGVTIGPLNTSGSYLTLRNVTVDVGSAHAPGGWSNSGNHITLESVAFHGPYVSLFLHGADVAWVGGELGAAGIIGGKRHCAYGDSEPVEISSIQRLRIAGVTFHRQDFDSSPAACSSNGFHLEMVRIDHDSDGVTIESSTFEDGDHSNTASIFITNVLTEPGDPTNLTFRNNFFGSADNSTFGVHSNVSDCSTVTIAYNTFLNGVFSSSCAASLIGNLGPYPTFAGCQGTHVKNVWQDSLSTTCGSDLWVMGTRYRTDALGLTVNDGGVDSFHLLPGSIAIDKGETAGYCTGALGAVDHDGNQRPKGMACNAGAHEL